MNIGNPSSALPTVAPVVEDRRVVLDDGEPLRRDNPLVLPGAAEAGDRPGDRPLPDGERAGFEQQVASRQNLSTEQQQELARLAARDREVRAHEQAHASVGGRYAGAPSYTLQRGPDGRQYAVAGEVLIDTAPIPNDPEATLAKAQVIRRAALAPQTPSAQDRAVAAAASALEREARQQINEAARAELTARSETVAAGGQAGDLQDVSAPADITNSAVSSFTQVAATLQTNAQAAQNAVDILV